MEELIFDNSNINYWFSSDYHYWHKNIIKARSRWGDKSGCRDFKDEREMCNHLVSETNKVVMPNDILFYLGDWSFGGIQNIWNFRKRLNVQTIYFCTGNHDHHIKKNKVLPNCSKETMGKMWFDDVEPELKYYEVKAQELFTDVQPMYEIMVHGQRMTLCHYAMRTWYFHNKGSWNLHGHSHSSLPPIGKQLDVGVDEGYKRFGTYRPFKFQEIQKIMSNREFEQIDGHSSKTNAR